MMYIALPFALHLVLSNNVPALQPFLTAAVHLPLFTASLLSQVVKKMWEYIRAHNLQNPADKREIRLDAALQEVFKVKTFNMFSMNKHIAKQMMRNE